MLTETALRTGCLNVFTPAGTQKHLDTAVLFERLLLLIYAYGTGTGIRAVAAGDHPHTEDDLRYARRRYLTVEACREVTRVIANATFAARQAALWGEDTMRHGTDMEIETNFVDSHGASFVGFGITRLLDFDLVARFKQINKMKLYVPGRGEDFSYPLLGPALTRLIQWDIITNNYDIMMKYATAIRLRTASTEALLRRFTSETTHPAYAAMLEVGRAQRTVFLARWLRDRDLQRETESGLNLVENYHGVNDYIKFGKRGELASNRREEQELGMLCLHILQSALGLINTLMVQDTLALPEWENVLADADRRGLTPLFHTNMTPYGEIQLRTDRRLDLTDLPTA
ncbi:Tn3 family transposase [Streptosporangium canum]|uniref:Tn3 family transposase n=1 Tax=Streptosporangium canum TaxID=324952 RepID=UPI0037ADB60F